MNTALQHPHTLAQVRSHGITFELTPNTYQRHLRRLWFFSLGFFVPMLALHMVLLQAGLETGTRAGILASAAVILGSVFFAFIRKGANPASPMLLIQDGQLLMEGSGEEILVAPLHELRVEYFGWGPEADCLLPAVRIWTSRKDSFSVGALRADETWSDLKSSAQATDYVLENWKGLVQALQQK